MRVFILLSALALALATVPVGAQDDAPERPYDYRFTRGDLTLASQACVHEATWAGASITGDCGGILQVVMSRRHEHERFEDALRRTMPRFYAGATTRSWTRHLPFGPIRVNPPGWPYEYPASHHSEDWHAVNIRVSHYMRGEEALPCSPEPVRWFGRTTDHAQLVSALARGWEEAECGESRNVFLYRPE